MLQETTKPATNFKELWEAFLRRRWLFAGGLFLMWLSIWAASWLLPSVYCSESVILVEQQKVPEEYVVANVNVDLQQRLEAMRQQILSRTKLLSIIDQYQLYGGNSQKNPDEAVEQMRKDIKTELVEAPGRRGQFSAFKISYNAPSAGLAQKVNAQLVALFVEQNTQEQEERSENTTEFLSTELEQARQHLAEQEARIKQFKLGNLGKLPSQTESNVRILSGLQERQHNLSQSLDRAQEQKLYLESLLAQYRSAAKTGNVVHSPNSVAALEEDLAKLKQELVADQTKYTPTHPDVLRLQRQISRTQKQLDDAKARAAQGDPQSADTTAGTPIPQLEGQLKANQQEIENTRRELQNINEQIASYQGRLNQAPITEQQLADLTRDYDQSKANYDSLLKKQMQSQLATNLEKRQQGEQFRIIDPASLPTKAIAPNRFKISLLGVFAGIVAGFVLIFLAETLDDRVRKEEDVTEIVKVRILAGVPHLSTPEEESKRRALRILEWCGVALVLALLIAGNVFTFVRG
ncbi:MAG TPA: GNVR domain-containing protein [candidate division Zixibacteria bacterium]|nr:GNVR domain-containing protein [candidate division Zixibacteria bacterium]